MQNLKYRNTRTEQPAKKYKKKVIQMINIYIDLLFTQIRNTTRYLISRVRQKKTVKMFYQCLW